MKAKWMKAMHIPLSFSNREKTRKYVEMLNAAGEQNQPIYLVVPLVHLTIVLPSSNPGAHGRDLRNEAQIRGPARKLSLFAVRAAV
jgi:hypothetical protein